MCWKFGKPRSAFLYNMIATCEETNSEKNPGGNAKIIYHNLCSLFEIEERTVSFLVICSPTLSGTAGFEALSFVIIHSDEAQATPPRGTFNILEHTLKNHQCSHSSTNTITSNRQIMLISGRLLLLIQNSIHGGSR